MGHRRLPKGHLLTKEEAEELLRGNGGDVVDAARYWAEEHTGEAPSEHWVFHGVWLIHRAMGLPKPSPDVFGVLIRGGKR